jgi:hypothetical protein
MLVAEYLEEDSEIPRRRAISGPQGDGEKRKEDTRVRLDQSRGSTSAALTVAETER